MQAIHGVVANAYAARMPEGMNHVKGIYANTQTGLSSKDFFKRTLRQMRRAQIPNQESLPPTYSYQNRPQPIYPHEIQVQPIGLAGPTQSLENALRQLPAASVPRGYRQSLLREAVAVPIRTGLAEPGMPNWGQMYEATEEGRPRVTRAMTANELRKEDDYTRVQADMRTGGPGPSMGIWAPSRVRTLENNGGTVRSASSTESARRDGRRRLSMAEEHAFLKHFPQRTDMVAVAKIPGPEGAPARAEIRRLTDAVFSNTNSSTESYASSESSLTSLDRAEIHRMANLTPEEEERLRILGLENMIPIPEGQGYDRWQAISEIRDVLRDFNSNSSSEQSSIHTQESIDDPLHLSGGEILLLRRQGPEGVEHIRLATTSAAQSNVENHVAQARAFLSASLLRQARSRSGSRSGSRGSISTLSRSENPHVATQSWGQANLNLPHNWAPNEPYNWEPGQYQAMHAAAFPEGSPQSPVSPQSLQSPLSTQSPVSPQSPVSTQSPESQTSILTESLGSLEPLESVGSSGARSIRSSRGSRGSRGSRRS
jgi:hypothetical protein